MKVVFAGHEVQGSAAFGAGFGKDERAVGEVEGGEVVAAAEFGVAWTPVKASGDHEVEDEPEVVVEADGDALADAAHLTDVAAFDIGDGWLYGSEQERAGDADVFERLADDARSERVNVGGDIGELRHRLSACIGRRGFATCLGECVGLGLG